MMQKIVASSSFSVFSIMNPQLLWYQYLKWQHIHWMDGFLVCVLPNMDLRLCGFAICDIGMKIVF